jgi:hypothetical protein
MSNIQQALHNDVQSLALLRDEMGLQAHLFRAEARTRWQELEIRWDEVKEHLQRAKIAAADAKPKIQSASRELIDTLKTSYSDFRDTLKL